MIIDFHSHIGETVGKSKEDLLHSMDESEIDRSVIFAGGSMKLSNEVLIETIDNHSDRFYGALYADPTLVYHPDYMKKVEQYLQHPSIIGVKFYCGYEYYFPHDDLLKPFFALLEKYNKVAIFHTGDTYTVLANAKLKYAQPLHIDEVAVDHPNLKIVIAHVGYPWHKDTAEILYKNKNVYADISGFVYGEFKEKDVVNFKKVLNEIETVYDNNWDRILFGTDWPISNQKSYVKTLTYRYDSDYLKVFSNNTEKLIKTILNK